MIDYAIMAARIVLEDNKDRNESRFNTFSLDAKQKSFVAIITFARTIIF